MNILALTFPECVDDVRQQYDKSRFYSSALYREVFKNGSTLFAAVPAFVKVPALAERMARDVRLPACRIAEKQEEDGVIKFATRLADGHRVESVIIPARGRTTLCVSSQVGCRMGCTFCATGGMGFVRDLHAEEIVWQVYAARFILKQPVDNIVFMGMGEPLDNVEAVLQAVRVISDQHGFDIPCSHITVSTAGHAEGLRKLGAANLPTLRLAVSLHAADDALRSRLMPINRLYPLTCLKEALRQFPLGKKGVLFVEVVLLAGVNDSHEDAKRIIHYLEDLPVRINLIAYNQVGSEGFVAPSDKQVRQFRDWLVAAGLFARIRPSRGQGVRAACGQLAAIACT
jgi:23S rRNA (adenine2503-C2)-methyltransferase